MTCQDLGRVTRCYVSGYQRNRIHQTNVVAQETRCFTADFNGAVPKGRTIASATWSVLNPYGLFLTSAEVTGRETSVVAQMNFAACTMLRCEATFDNGEVYSQMFKVNVSQWQYFYNQPVWSQGPYSLTAVPA